MYGELICTSSSFRAAEAVQVVFNRISLSAFLCTSAITTEVPFDIRYIVHVYSYTLPHILLCHSCTTSLPCIPMSFMNPSIAEIT